MIIASKEYVIKRMTELMINPKKKFSQNFLTSYEVVKESVDSLHLESDDVIIEIGPGLGALTQELLNRGNQVYAYDIDLDMVNHLKEVFKGYSNFHLFNQDFMKTDLSSFEGKVVKVISNVPYNLTTPIIEKIVTSSINVKVFEFMVQKEVYDRIKAKKGSKDYAPLNIFIEYVGNLSIVKKVSRIDGYYIPIVVLTANVTQGIKEKYLGVGFDDYLAKPIDKKELSRVLKEYLKGRKKKNNN